MPTRARSAVAVAIPALVAGLVLGGAPQAAAFGAVATLSLGLADALSYALPIAAIAGAFASVFLLVAVAGRRGQRTRRRSHRTRRRLRSAAAARAPLISPTFSSPAQ